MAMLFFLSLLFCLALPQSDGLAAQGYIRTRDAEQNSWCQECHGNPEFEFRDPLSGAPKTLFVDTAAYRASVHGELACRSCHEPGYHRVPHPHSGYYSAFLCVDCHTARGSDVHLGERLREHKRALVGSVHGRELGRPLDCHVCHDPHTFRMLEDAPSAQARTGASNDLCLGCHGSLALRRVPEGDDRLPDVHDKHQHLPSPEVHFRKVRCVTCHTPIASGTRHDVEPGAEAERECRACHAQQSARLHANFGERRGSVGLAEERVRRNAYVIGSTRSATLDRASQVGFLVLLAVVCVHGGARLLARRKAK